MRTLLMLISLSAGIYAVHTTVEWMDSATKVIAGG
jgi:hypothetical protein